MLRAAGRASAAARPPVCGTLGVGVRAPGAAAHSVRAAGRRQPWRRWLGNARRPRPGVDSPEASAARVPFPAAAGRCLRAKQARGGGWERAGKRAGGGGEARAGRNGSVRPRGFQTGLKYPGGGAAPPTRAPRPGPKERGEVVQVGEAERSLAGGQLGTILRRESASTE
ncbi:translation initiation factor IF-2-like [Felis catus]|uniref:translation initiation factor IF-2-like n=1 Tax=Felis catus TaxID=9685 RepID=UPI001D19CF26|nr:translation initiation factor IF-2-like [Felis catus]